MQQLLNSIQQISESRTDGCNVHFESHIFLDDGVKENKMSESALLLLSVVKDELSK
jgi:hypothetical protein